jgi:histidine ammonia-lyase
MAAHSDKKESMSEATESDLGVVTINGRELTVYDVYLVAHRGVRVAIAQAALQAVKRARAAVEAMVNHSDAVYGINTGFGFMKNQRIASDELEALQHNLIRSHAAGVGVPFKTPIVRAMMLLRLNALIKGYSGIRPIVITHLTELLNQGVHPLIPSQGSVGASGDLAPLSHMALVLIGEGFAEYRGRVLSGAEALQAVGLEPLRLAAKEGLALVNGTQAMAAMGCLAIEQARSLAKVADIATASAIEALLGSNKPFQSAIHLLRPHTGQMASARNLTRLTTGSQLMATHANCDQIQDGYSLRCAPQIHGASRDTFAYARQIFQVEINSVTDNPLIFSETGVAISAGHFHGQPLALPLDFMAIAVAELGNVSERRTERMVNPALSNGLPAFLVAKPGLHSGLMVAQYTAASLVSENKGLCHPASVDSIPTSAGQEDHVSMGTNAARKLLQVIDNTRRVLAIELICAMQGIEHRTAVPISRGVAAAKSRVRQIVPYLSADRVLSTDIEALSRAIEDGTLIEAVEEAIGPLE